MGTESTDGSDQEPPPAQLALWTESALAARAPSPVLVAWSGARQQLEATNAVSLTPSIGFWQPAVMRMVPILGIIME
jgi:hypothetical protein